MLRSARWRSYGCAGLDIYQEWQFSWMLDDLHKDTSLHANLRMVFASAIEGKSLEEIVQLADKIVDISPLTTAAITSTTPANNAIESPKWIRTEVDRLMKLVTMLQHEQPLWPCSLLPRCTQPRTNTPPPYPRQPRRRMPPPDTHICGYYAWFGDRARNCTPTFSTSGNYLDSS